MSAPAIPRTRWRGLALEGLLLVRRIRYHETGLSNPGPDPIKSVIDEVRAKASVGAGS